MKQILNAIPAPAWYAVAGLVAFGVVLVLARRGAGAVAAGINPVNPKNVFYSGSNALGSALSGDESFSLGAKIYDWTHPDEPFTR